MSILEAMPEGVLSASAGGAATSAGAGIGGGPSVGGALASSSLSWHAETVIARASTVANNRIIFMAFDHGMPARRPSTPGHTIQT